MIPTDTQGRLLLAAARHDTLRAAAAGTSLRGLRPLRRALGRGLVAAGVRLAGDERGRLAAAATPSEAARRAAVRPSCACC